MENLDEFNEFKKNIRKVLKEDLARFNLKIREAGATEFIIYQGVFNNVWARVSTTQCSFHNAKFERALGRLGISYTPNRVLHA